MKYSIYKDKKPKDTIKKIKKIFKDLKIELKEEVRKQENTENLYSTRISIVENDVVLDGTNGKGTSLENALASGYAELMERVQNNKLGFMRRAENIDYFYTKKYELVSDITFEQLYEIESNNTSTNKEPKELSASTFLNLKDKKTHSIPFVITDYYSANGMCAGNTEEEAILQGLCEICERHSVNEIFRKQISIPDIPKEEYQDFEIINNMIQAYRQAGYKVSIKDASMYNVLPVICTIIEIPNTDIFFVSFGSHPSLLVAIERSLTEATQGLDLNDKRNMINTRKFGAYQYLTKKNFEKIENISHKLPWSYFLNSPPYFEKNDFFNKILFSNKPSYNFSKKTFIEQNSKWNNKKILEFLCLNINKLDWKVYVKDVSYLGFPSFHIYVPNVSRLIDLLTTKEEIKMFSDSHKFEYCIKNKQNSKITDEMLKNTLIAYTLYNLRQPNDDLPYEYLLLLYSILHNEIDNIIFYSDFLIEKMHSQHNISATNSIYHLIKDFYTLKKEKVNEEEIYTKLKKKYSNSLIYNFINLKNNLSVLNIVEIFEKMYIEKILNQEAIDSAQKIRNILLEKRKKFKPNYSKIKKLFSFIK